MDFKSPELAKTARFMIKELLLCEPGSNLVITADSGSDRRLVDALINAAYVEGVNPVALWMPMLKEVNMEPSPPVAGAMKEADRICLLEKVYFIHSDALRQALKNGARADFFGGMDVDSILRCVGNINFRAMVELGDNIVKLIKDGKEMKISTPAGTDLVMRLDPHRPIYHHTGVADKPNDITFLGGQIAFAPIEDSISGKVVFDGSLWPPNDLGLLNTPVELTVEQGKIILVVGQDEAKRLEKWLKSFNHPNCYNVAHISPGFNPGAKLLGNIVEDERVFGIIEIGVGTQSDHFLGGAGRAPSHTDGIMLNPSFWVDGVLIEEEGEYIHPELLNLSKAAQK